MHKVPKFWFDMWFTGLVIPDRKRNKIFRCSIFRYSYVVCVVWLLIQICTLSTYCIYFVKRFTRYTCIFREKTTFFYLAFDSFDIFWVRIFAGMASFQFGNSRPRNCQIKWLSYRRFAIRKLETQKWVSMFLSYLLENVFLVILRRRIFLFFEVFFQKKLFKGAKVTF